MEEILSKMENDSNAKNDCYANKPREYALSTDKYCLNEPVS